MAQGKYLSSTTITFLILISHFSFIIAIDIPEHNSPEKKLYVVYTDDYDYVKILTPVLGSEEAAKHAIVYSYGHVVKGFSASLTPEQASRLSKQPGVLSVQDSRKYYLHDKDFGIQTKN